MWSRRVGILAGAVLLLSASAVLARPAESQRNYNTGTGTVAPWWRVAVTAHHTLIAGVSYTGGTGVTITPPAGWQQIDTTNYRSDNGTTIGTAVFYYPDCPAKPLHTLETFTFAPASTVATVQLTEVAGIVTTSPVDSAGIGLATGNANNVTITGAAASAETSEYGYTIIASAAQSASPGNGTNGFGKMNSYLYNTLTQASNLDAGASTRTITESTLITSAAGSAVSTKISGLPAAAFSGVLVTFKVQALYWIGSGTYLPRPVNPSVPDPNTCYGYFDDDACWANTSGGTWTGTASPGVNDVVIFDGGGGLVGNCTMNPWTAATEQAYSIEVDSGYTGTISKTGSDLQLQRHFTLGGGSFIGSAGLNFNTNQTGAYAGDMDVQGGTFSGNGMTVGVRALYVEGGTLNMGSGTFTTNAGGVVNVIGGTTTFGGSVSFVSSLTMTGGSMTAGSGTFSVSGATSITGGASFSAGASSSATFTGSVTVGSATPTVGTFSGGTATLTFSSTISLNDATFDLSTATGYSFASSISVQTGSIMSLGAAGSSMSPVSFPSTLLVRGSTGGTSSTFNAGSGFLTVTGTTTIDQTAIFSGGTGTVNFTGVVVVGATTTAGTFNAGSGTINFNNASASGVNDLLVQFASSAFNGQTAHVNFGNNTVSGAIAVRLASGTINLSTATPTFNGAGNVNASAGTTITMGSATVSSIPGTSTLAGTFIMGSGGVTFSGPTTMSGTFTGGSGAQTFGSTATISGTFNPAGGATTFSSTLTASGTFTAGTGPMTFSAAVTNNGGTMNLANASALTFTAGTLTVSGGTTSFTLGAQTVTIPALNITGGAFHSGTSNLTFTGLVQTAATLDLQSAATLTFGAGLIAGGTTTFGSQTVSLASLSASGVITGNTVVLTVTGATLISGGTVGLGSTTTGPTFMGTYTMSGGTLTMGSGNPAFQGAVSMTNGTLNNSSGSCTMQSTLTMTGGIINVLTGHLTVTGTTSIAGTTTIAGGTVNVNTGILTFSGQVLLGGSDGTLGTMNALTGTVSFEFPTTAMVTDSLLVQGTGTFTVSNTNPSASVTFGKNAIAGTNAINLVGGSVKFQSVATPTFMAGNVTIGTGTTLQMASTAATFPATVTVNGTFTEGTGNLTFSGPVVVAGTFTGNSGTLTFNSTLGISMGGTLAGNTTQATFASPVTVTGTFNGGNGARNFNDTLSVTGTYTAGFGTHTFAKAVTNSAGTLNFSTTSPTINFSTVSATLNVTGGATSLGSPGSCTMQAINVSSGTLTVANAGMTVGGATTITGGSMTISNTTRTVAFNSTVNIGPGTLTVGQGAAVSRTVNFNAAVTVGDAPGSNAGTLSLGAAVATFSSGFSIVAGSTFNGNTATATFSVAPTLTSGTFNVGDAASAGRLTFNTSASFASGMTLAFPTSGSELSMKFGNTLTIAGTLSSSGGAVATRPKIDCNGCTVNQGYTVSVASTAVLNANGISFDHVATTGVQIADGATFTAFRNIKFTNNAAGGTVSGTHLSITSSNTGGNKIILAPGAFFDATAKFNVTLTGVVGSTGVRAVFENQSTAVNGARAGDTFDSDGDTNHDNIAEGVDAAHNYGAVVEWVAAAPSDTQGTNVGVPTAAFDWTTFANYGVYVSYKDANGTNDRLWLRNADGTAAYFYDVPQTSGDIIGTPLWDTVDETALGFDVNGNGTSTDTDLHVVYIGTSGGHVIKLIDNGTTLAAPASGAWSTDFTSGSVSTISSPLANDFTNLYFGGTGGATTKLFGVQITGGASEKTLTKNIGSVSAITAALSWKVYSGSTYLFVGSTATSGQAYIYRINATSAVIDATFSGVTTSVNSSVRLVADHAYAVTDGGTLHVIDAANFAGGSGAFTNLTGFPYQSTAASPIQSAAWVDPYGNSAYFGDNAGNLYVVTSAGANLAGYPSTIMGTAASASPFYLSGGGIIAVGGADGYLYFINRQSATHVPALQKKYFVGTGAVSSVTYNGANAEYMVSTSDGKLSFIKASDIPADADGVE